MPSGNVIFVIVILVVMWLLLVRPQRRRQLEQQRMWQQVAVGDEIVTAGGIFGEVTQVREDGDLVVRIAPELEVRVARRAVAGVTKPTADESQDDDHGYPSESG